MGIILSSGKLQNKGYTRYLDEFKIQGSRTQVTVSLRLLLLKKKKKKKKYYDSLWANSQHNLTVVLWNM